MKQQSSPRTRPEILRQIKKGMAKGNVALVAGTVRLRKLKAEGLITDIELKEATGIDTVQHDGNLKEKTE